MDIAGLVRGASKGEGLGNKFLQHIREVDAIVEVVRCFENKDIVHVSGHLDPVSDIETIQTELVLADIETATRARDKFERLARGADREAKEAREGLEVADKLLKHFDSGKRALSAPLSDDEKAVAARLFLLTSKPILFACNVAEDELATAEQSSPHVAAVKKFAQTHLGTEAVVVSAAIESELAELPDAEAREYLAHLGRLRLRASPR